MLVLVDSGILLRLLEPSDPQHAAIRGAVRALRSRGDTLVTTAQNAAEFWNVCTRPPAARGGYGLSIADADRRLRVIERLFHVLPDSPAAYQIWRGLLVAYAVKGVQVHDARLVALMQVNEIAHILTLNSNDFARYTGIVPIAPTSLRPPAASNAARTGPPLKDSGQEGAGSSIFVTSPFPHPLFRIIPDDRIETRNVGHGPPRLAFQPHGEVGGHIYASGEILVDSGLLNEDLLKKDYGKKAARRFERSRLRDRLDSILAHEFEEHRHGMDHGAAVRFVPETELPIRDRARRILEEMRKGWRRR